MWYQEEDDKKDLKDRLRINSCYVRTVKRQDMKFKEERFWIAKRLLEERRICIEDKLKTRKR